LISRRLVEIYNLVYFSTPVASRQVKAELIDDHLLYFIRSAVVPVLINQSGMKENAASKFVTHLLQESLVNVLQHPNATIGMFSISRIGTDKLVLAVADNGDSICKTIYKHYRHTQGNRRSGLPAVYAGNQLTVATRCDLIVHATKEGVSRKLLSEEADWQEIEFDAGPRRASEIGMGLTHIRDATVDEFRGNLVIATEGVGVTFKRIPKSSQKQWLFEDLGFRWPGNLLRIQIQAKERVQAEAPAGA